MRPSKLALRCVAGWLMLGVLVSFWPQFVLGFVGAGLALLLLLGLDAAVLLGRPDPAVTRDVPPTMALGEHYNIAVSLNTGRAQEVRLHDHPPFCGETSAMPLHTSLAGDRWHQVGYAFRPMARGELVFEQATLQWSGPFRLLEQFRRVGEVTSTRVYPNFRKTSRYAVAGEQGAFQGAHLTRRRGLGREFHQLREFREGDSIRQIDWKSVSRRQQLVSREYRSEQNQNIVFMVDCGRRMRAHDGEFTLMDQSLNALLLLSHVALRQGDSVGVLTFGGSKRWLPPVRGASAISRVLHVTHDLDSTTEPSDFEEAVGRFSARQRRRTLLVLLTNVGDDDADSLLASLVALRAKHVVLLVSLRDPDLTRRMLRDVESHSDGQQMLSTLAYLGARRQARRKLVSTGLSVLESEPGVLPKRLIEYYMKVKRAGVL